MQAARHGAKFAKAKALRKSMSGAQLKEWTSFGPPSARKKEYQSKGMSEHEATKKSLRGK